MYIIRMTSSWNYDLQTGRGQIYSASLYVLPDVIIETVDGGLQTTIKLLETAWKKKMEVCISIGGNHRQANFDHQKCMLQKIQKSMTSAPPPLASPTPSPPHTHTHTHRAEWQTNVKYLMQYTNVMFTWLHHFLNANIHYVSGIQNQTRLGWTIFWTPFV